MPKEKDIQFLPLVKETFDQVFKDYGFEIQSEADWDGHGEYSVTASKDDMMLIFYLGSAPLFYYFDLGIKLSGDLAKKATSSPLYQNRSISVMTIAGYLDPVYKKPTKASQTKQELRDAMERGKEDLLKYCKDILSGDVTIWSGVVDQITEQRKKSGIKIHGQD